MQVLKNIISSVVKRPSLYLFIFLVVFSFDRYQRWVNFDKDKFPFVNDVDQYYSYLPAALIHNDLSFNFSNDYWTTNLPNGNHIPKVTVGMAVMYSPFFIMGHVVAKATGYQSNGYSLPYKWCIHFGSILFSLLGLWFSRKNLLFYFNETVTVISLIGIYLGTNLFYYTYGSGEMPHAYLFFIFSLFIFYTIKWHRTNKFRCFLVFSFLAGFATLIRPTECVILLFPLLLEVKNRNNLTERLKKIVSLKLKLIIAFGVFILPFFVQMCYWKMYAGSWLFFSYGNERFFFTDPQIINFLFSFRKGWLLYTPMMIFAVAGLFFLRRKASGLMLFLPVYLVLNIYLLSSWWDWSFGGSFGCRPLIQHYAFLVFALAAFVDYVFNLFSTKPVINLSFKIVLAVIFYMLIVFNYKQAWQFKYGILASDGMTKEAYFFILGKEKFTPAELDELNTKIKQVDREVMLSGNRD